MKIRSDILRIYQSLHTWVGICAGVFLFIAFFAGALTMFKQPIDDWMASAPSSRLQGVSAAQIDSLVRQLNNNIPQPRNGFKFNLSQITRPTSLGPKRVSGEHLISMKNAGMPRSMHKDSSSPCK